MRDEIERELTRYFDLIDLNQREFGLDPNMQFVHFAHSGDFQPLIEALEDPDLEYRSRIKTLVVYEGPYVGDGIINDPYLETIIRVRGTQTLWGGDVGPPFLEHQQFNIQDQNGDVVPVQNQYNIEILGAGHLDFSCSSGANHDACTDFINQQTNLFMRDLQLKAADSNPNTLQYFLSSSTPGVSVDPSTGIITVKPDEYVSPFGNRS